MLVISRARTLVLFAFVVAAAGCDSKAAAPAADPAADAKAKEEADSKARIEKRKQEREAKDLAEKQTKEAIAAKIIEVSVIPEGTKLPKKPAEACAMVVEAQRGFMKKFHPQIDEAMLTTQLGLLLKQCMEMNDVKVAVCQKFALDATDELLKGSINEYLPACMGKYGKG